MSHAANKAARMAAILKVMTTPMSVSKIATLVPYMHETSLYDYIVEMADDGLVYVAGTGKAHHSPVRLWMRTPKGEEGVPIPQTREKELTEAEIFRRPPTVVHVRRDPLVVALFGEAA